MPVKDFENVKEHYMLYDTVGVYQPALGATTPVPPGWHTNYIALGAVNEVHFFNVRNRNSGLYWNNQDKRDQLAWPFLIKSLGISWHASPITVAPAYWADYQFSPEDYASHMFINDLPRHTGVILQIQQDERLKTHSFFCSPGYGVCGGGYGRGAPSTFTPPNGYDHHLAVHNQGIPMFDNRWQFPINLEVPRNASLSVRLIINEYGRQMLANMPFEGPFFGDAAPGLDDNQFISPFSMIQVSLHGKRLVQQRGQYHR